MGKYIILSMFFWLGCTSPKKQNNPVQLKYNLFVNEQTGTFYFRYEIPKRAIVNGEEEISSHFVYDSTVALGEQIILIKEIIDTASYTMDDSLDSFYDKDHYYQERDMNIRPKFLAIPRKD